MKKSEISLGMFRAEIGNITAPYLTYDNPLKSLSVSMPIDRVSVILGASPYIVFCSGLTRVTLSHVQNIKRSMKEGKRHYKIICSDYTQDTPVSIEYHLFCEK